MRYLTDDDFQIIDKQGELEEKCRLLKKEWEKEIAAAKNEAEYEAARPKFEEYSRAHKEWRKYFDKEYIKLIPSRIE